MSDAKVYDLDMERLRRRLRDSLNVNACVAEANKLRRQAAELTMHGRDKEATDTLMEVARIMRHVRALNASIELAKGRT